MSKLGKARGCVGGLILGSAIRALVFILSALIKFLASVMVFLGLWVPFFYALLGAILYLVFKFDPFSGSIDSKIYLAGFAATVLCALLITIKHLFEKPAESVAEGFKRPIWKKPQEEDYEEDERESPSRSARRETRRYEDETEYRRPVSRDEYSRRQENNVPRGHDRDYYEKDALLSERPKIYYSAIEKDTLIHEYSDRFEVYRMIGGRAVPDKVEYKNL